MAEQGVFHHAVLEGIKRRMRPFNEFYFSSEKYRLEKQRTFKIYQGYNAEDPVDRQNAQHFVNHIHIHLHSHPVIHLHLSMVTFSDEALDVLCDLFANDTTPTLTQFELYVCRFRRTDWVSKLISSFQTNTSVTDVKIEPPHEEVNILDSDTLAGLIENNPYMQKITFVAITIQLGNEDGLRQALQGNRTLKEFHLMGRDIGDDRFRVITDGLVGNATLEVLEIHVISGYRSNPLTPINALSNMTRLLESTHLKELICGPIDGIINNAASVRSFAGSLSRNLYIKSLDVRGATVSSSVAIEIFQALGRNTTLENLALEEIQHGDLRPMETLPMMKGLRRLTVNSWGWGRTSNFFLMNRLLPGLRRNTSLEELPGLDLTSHYDQYRETIMEMESLLARNRNVKRVVSLLQPQRDTGKLIPSSSWILRRAIAQLARDTPSRASAIYQMLQSRPTVFDTPMRPPVPPHAAEQQQNRLIIDNAGNVHDDSRIVDIAQQHHHCSEHVDDNVNGSNDSNELQQHDRLDDDDNHGSSRSSINDSSRKRARLA